MVLEKAKEILVSGNYTCALTDGATVYTSTLRGVRPLVQFLEKGTNLIGFSAADKVVGKATAYLYVRAGIRELFAQVISQPAIDVLTAHGITVSCNLLVPAIINRKGDGICPFEATVLDIHNPADAYSAILRKMREMNIPIH